MPYSVVVCALSHVASVLSPQSPRLTLMIATRISLLLTISIFLVSQFARAETLVYEGDQGFGKGKHIVFVANDHEYRSEQTSPLIAKMMAKRYGFRCTVLFGIDESGFIKAGAKSVPGLESLADADLLFFFTRFMNLPDEQADLLVDYFERGGPVVGIRTSTHCFNGQKGKWAKLNFDNDSEDDYFGGLGHQIFGLTWGKKKVPGQSHYGSNHKMGGRVTVIEAAKNHPVVSGVGEIHAYSGAYSSPPPAGATSLLEVQVLNTFEPSDDINEDKPIVVAGWTRDHYVAPSGNEKDARVVYTSMGASEDLLDEDARRFMINACLWAGGWEEHIKPDSDVSIVGQYNPSPYTTGAFYCENVRPSDLSGWDSQIMPADASLAGVGNEKTAKKHSRVIDVRPKLKEQLLEKYPDVYGALAQ